MKNSGNPQRSRPEGRFGTSHDDLRKGGNAGGSVGRARAVSKEVKMVSKNVHV